MIDLTPLEQAVVDGRKPGALGLSGGDLIQDEAVYASLGLEMIEFSVKGELLRTLGHQVLARTIWEQFKTTPRLDAYKPKIDQLLTVLGDQSIASALAFMRTFYSPARRTESDIMYGALFGYKPCCVEYFVATRKENEPQRYDRKDLRLSDAYHTTPDMHVFCLKCITAMTE
jgi:hypothetical protein